MYNNKIDITTAVVCSPIDTSSYIAREVRQWLKSVLTLDYVNIAIS